MWKSFLALCGGRDWRFGRDALAAVIVALALCYGAAVAATSSPVAANVIDASHQTSTATFVLSLEQDGWTGTTYGDGQYAWTAWVKADNPKITTVGGRLDSIVGEPYWCANDLASFVDVDGAISAYQSFLGKVFTADPNLDWQPVQNRPGTRSVSVDLWDGTQFQYMNCFDN